MRILCLWLVLFFTPSLLQARTLVFAPLPMENRETVLKQFMPLALYLEESLGCKIVFDYSDNYAQILEKFELGRLDLAYLGPLPYVSLRAREEKATPIVHFREASGDALYTCAIVAMADSGIDLKELKNHKVALTQPLSTCGFLSTNGLLREQGADLSANLYRYLKKHDEVAKAVVRGEFDIGGLKSAIGRKYAHLGLAILAETEPLPSFAIVGNSGSLSQEERDAILHVLTRLDPAGRDKEMLSAWGENIRHGAVPAKDSDYNSVRALLGDSVIPESGNF